MVDFAAGHPTNEQSHPIVAALDAALGDGRDGVRFHPGVEYRHLCVVPSDLGRRRVHAAARPHRTARGVPDRPRGAEAARVDGRVACQSSRDAARAVGCAATQIWLWGQGVKPALPSFDATYGVAGRMSSAVDLVQGLGVLTGIEVVDVPGATAGFDNDYGAQARRVPRVRSTIATCSSCTSRRPTRPGHQGRADIKVDALERWDPDDHRPDRRRARRGGEPYRILLLPDHATPCDINDAQRRTGAVPAVRLDRVTRPAACTPNRRPRDARRCRRTS